MEGHRGSLGGVRACPAQVPMVSLQVMPARLLPHSGSPLRKAIRSPEGPRQEHSPPRVLQIQVTRARGKHVIVEEEVRPSDLGVFEGSGDPSQVPEQELRYQGPERRANLPVMGTQLNIHHPLWGWGSRGSFHSHPQPTTKQGTRPPGDPEEGETGEHRPHTSAPSWQGRPSPVPTKPNSSALKWA